MGARQSDAMVKAKKLMLVDGLSAYAAAKKVGITKQAIYMSKWYKDHKNVMPR